MFKRIELDSVTNRLYILIAVATIAVSIWGLFWLLDTRDQRREALLLGAVRFVEAHLVENNPQIRFVKLFAPSLHPESLPNTWTLSAVAKLEDSLGRSTFTETASTVENVCSSYYDKECWNIIRIVGAQMPSEGTTGVMPTTENPATEKPAGAGAGGGSSAFSSVVPVQITDTPSAPPVAASASTREASANSQPVDGFVESTVDGVERRTVAVSTGFDDRPAKGEGEQSARAPVGDPQNDNEKLVFELQMRLRDVGFLPGPLDGNLGPRTAAAIMAYQQRHKLKVDGKPSRELLNHLISRSGDG